MFQGTKQLRVTTDLMTLHAAPQNQSSTTIRSNFTTVSLPPSLIQTVFARLGGLGKSDPCVLRVLIEHAQNPYCWATHPAQVRPAPGNAQGFTDKNFLIFSFVFAQLTGPVVSLHLHECSTRRRIRVGSLPQPISFELQHPQKNVCFLFIFTAAGGKLKMPSGLPLK